MTKIRITVERLTDDHAEVAQIEQVEFDESIAEQIGEMVADQVGDQV